MESAAVETFLRLLRRRLHRQLQLLREERLPEALDLEPELEGMLAELATIDSGDVSGTTHLDHLRDQCGALVEKIQPFFDRERRLLSKEWVELQVESELRRLSHNDGPDRPDQPPRSGRRTSFTD